MPAELTNMPFASGNNMQRIDLKAVASLNTKFGDFLQLDANGLADQALTLAGTSSTTILIAGVADQTPGVAYAASADFQALKADKDIEFTAPLVSATGTAIAWSQSLVGASRPMYRSSGGFYCVDGVTTTVNISCCKIIGVEESSLNETFKLVKFQILPAFLKLGQ
jgi:hypothetical protein